MVINASLKVDIIQFLNRCGNSLLAFRRKFEHFLKEILVFPRNNIPGNSQQTCYQNLIIPNAVNINIQLILSGNTLI